jgi:hypothetical protein
MRRNLWTSDTLQSVNWKAHGAAHSKLREQRTFLVKLCYHRHLPIEKCLHRRDSKYPATCPGCRNDIEDHDHFIGCTAPSRIKWRTELLTSICTQLTRSKTNTELEETMVNVLDRAIAGLPISVNSTFTRALRAQEKIGWRSMLQGHWASEWQNTYHKIYHKPTEETPADKTKRKTNMERWQSKLITTTWTNMITLWTLPNDERHGRNKERRERARHKVLTNELQILYNNQDQYPTDVKNLLRTTFVDHCRDKSSAIEDWLNAFRATFQVMHIPPSG